MEDSQKCAHGYNGRRGSVLHTTPSRWKMIRLKISDKGRLESPSSLSYVCSESLRDEGAKLGSSAMSRTEPEVRDLHLWPQRPDPEGNSDLPMS